MNAILYARYSPRPKKKKVNAAGQIEEIRCESIETQLKYCRDYCRLYNLTIIAEYSDTDLSGASQEGRPGLADALAHACREQCHLVFYSLTRLARNTPDAIDIANRCRDSGVHMVSYKEQFDTSTAMGRLFFTILAAFATWEREEISERTSDAMLQHQSAGRRMTPTEKIPFGYMVNPKDPSTIIPSPAEIAVINRIHELRPGNGYRAIAKQLEEECHKPRGERWHHVTIRRILERYPQPIPEGAKP